MNTTNVVNALFAELQKGHFNKANALLADNFYGTILGKRVNKQTYISTCRAIIRGMPDMQFHVQDVKIEGRKVMAKVLLSGTNSQPIPALINGWPQIPPTHKKVDGMIAGLEVTLNGDRIEKIKSSTHEKGLFANLLDHLGVNYTQVQPN